jgi:uncharacterized membrane protein YqjE
MGIIWGIITILFVFWLLGLVMHIGGGLIHILLVLALIGVVWNLFMGRRSAV